MVVHPDPAARRGAAGSDGLAGQIVAHRAPVDLQMTGSALIVHPRAGGRFAQRKTDPMPISSPLLPEAIHALRILTQLIDAGELPDATERDREVITSSIDALNSINVHESSQTS